MHKKAYATNKKKQKGMALIESLMAVCLFSLGILALVGLQAVMSKNVTQSKLRGEASFLANQLIGQMWVDQTNLASYAIVSGACTASNYAKCTNWNAAVQQILPSGVATVTVNGSNVSVRLNWQLPGEGEVPGEFQIAAYITN
jgi:type IV pilus assembly protein PilV